MSYTTRIKICFSIILRNIFWGVGAVLKNIRPLFRKKFMSLLIISSILQQSLLYVSTLPPLPFKASTSQHFSLDPPPPSTASAESAFLLRSPPHKYADVILERSLSCRHFQVNNHLYLHHMAGVHKCCLLHYFVAENDKGSY